MDETENIPPELESETPSNPSSEIPEEAFLVLEGARLVPLVLSVINIGRRLENNIVIDDPRVSRYHARLKAVDGNYELTDLNSSGGTFINGMRITKSVLYSGDEVSLAGFAIIYRQHGAPPRTDLRETGPLESEK